MEPISGIIIIIKQCGTCMIEIMSIDGTRKENFRVYQRYSMIGKMSSWELRASGDPKLQICQAINFSLNRNLRLSWAKILGSSNLNNRNPRMIDFLLQPIAEDLFNSWRPVNDPFDWMLSSKISPRKSTELFFLCTEWRSMLYSTLYNT